MTFDDWKIIAKGLKSAYTYEKFLPDADALNVWFELLKDIEYQILNMACQQYISTNKFAPTIADLRELCSNTVNGELPDYGKAWEEVLMAIRKCGMYQEDLAFERMSEQTRQVVKRMGFKNLCTSENVTADRANFRMIYEQISQRKKTDMQIPQNVKNAISAVQGNLIESKGE